MAFSINLKRVQVLDLGARAEFALPLRAHRNVGIAAERPFLHVAITDLEVADQRVDLLEVGDGLRRRAHIGLRNDFQQRRTGPIEVDAGQAVKILMQRLARIFFEMRTRQADNLALRRPRAGFRSVPP